MDNKTYRKLPIIDKVDRNAKKNIINNKLKLLTMKFLQIETKKEEENKYSWWTQERMNKYKALNDPKKAYPP